ncbi:MAG: hypothetical protein JWM10_3017 [Myxococcaceae bacterium]|nr:hypothetical protein [Myxococcaceae bacterium]
MSNPFVWLRERVLAVLVDGRGADGALGAEPQARAIAVGRFRRAAKNAPLRDPSYPAEAFDRAVQLDWLDDGDADGVQNSLDLTQYVTARFSLTHGVVYGPALAGWAMLYGTEVAADAVVGAKERAFNDAERMKVPLHYLNGLLRDGTETDPIPVACVRQGATSTVDLGGGRLLATSIYELQFRTTTGHHDP